MEDKLSFGQIAALRFASDEELPGLVKRAIAENLSPDNIKNTLRIGWLMICVFNDFRQTIFIRQFKLISYIHLKYANTISGIVTRQNIVAYI